jgi:hypothetical protein
LQRLANIVGANEPRFRLAFLAATHEGAGLDLDPLDLIPRGFIAEQVRCRAGRRFPFLRPNRKNHNGADIGLALLLIPDLRCKKLDEALLCIAASLHDQVRNVPSPGSGFQDRVRCRDQISRHDIPMNSTTSFMSRSSTGAV